MLVVFGVVSRRWKSDIFARRVRLMCSSCYREAYLDQNVTFFGWRVSQAERRQEIHSLSLLPGGCLEIEERGGQGVACMDGESTQSVQG